jgi:hypothetical protein
MRKKAAGLVALLGGLLIFLGLRRRPSVRLTALDAIELGRDGGFDPRILAGAGDWELVEEGGNTKDGYEYKDPHRCECGLSWDVNDADSFFNRKPNAQDIANCLATMQYPNKASEPCDEPCVAVEKGRFDRWRIFKNKKTGQFWLHCSKRVQWHCEIVQN